MLNSWHAWFGTFTGVAALTLLSLPVAAVTAAVLGWRRKAAGTASPWRLSFADVGMVHGTVPWVWMVLLPGEHPGVERGPLNLVPLRDLLEMDTGQVVGNLFIFAALGFFAPQRFAALASLPRVLALAGGWSALLEITQYLWLDRVSSVDDVLLNAAGAGLAALASRRWWRRPAELHEDTAVICRAG
ncbi:VanZ family protein [Lentzea roselyniae]